MSRFGITDPTTIIEKAKQKALESLNNPNPKMTKLELAFRHKYLQEQKEVITKAA